MGTTSKKGTFMVQSRTKHLVELSNVYARWIFRKLKHRWSDESEQAINLAVHAFRQSVFTDPDTGISLKYNLFVPNDYDASKSYPLVLFIHDAGVVSNDPRITLIQGLGAVIWAIPSEQAKHESFVLAPQYPTVTVNDYSEAKPHLDATVNLVRAVASQYNIDENRLYTTGQSMGCMMSIEMMIRNPGLFAAALLIAGQWDATRMSVLAEANMWVVVSERNPRAFQGMNASMAALEAAGAKISRATWSGRASSEEFAIEVRKMIAEGNNIKYTVFAEGTVVPEGLPDDHRNNHIYTWRVAYTIEGLRDWLFTQAKTTN
jgi:predicted peptidase